ncbi:RNA ligase [Flavobacterium columnare]|uniref:RNA ligase n=2 Tax=Flavobacterium TaxID=237 RepID=A0A2N9P9X7_9FLAO|nr:RNA ligase [Flavobacterium columnare]
MAILNIKITRMSLSKKYNRTYHFPFSPGTTSDDRISHEYWDYIQQIPELLITEKLDGENTCLNQYGVFARSHAAPTTHPWANYLKEYWHLIKNELKDLEIFGENLYATHSITYQNIESHFYVFAARYKDHWLSWEEVVFYASLLDLKTVPVLDLFIPKEEIELTLKEKVLEIIARPSVFDSYDVHTQEPCTMEGIVARNTKGYLVDDFYKNVFKYVRKNHVKTDEHWTRNWKRAQLNWEKNVDINK